MSDDRAVLALRALRMRHEGWLSEEEFERFRHRQDGAAALAELDEIERVAVNAPRLSGSGLD